MTDKFCSQHSLETSALETIRRTVANDIEAQELCWVFIQKNKRAEERNMLFLQNMHFSPEFVLRNAIPKRIIKNYKAYHLRTNQFYLRIRKTPKKLKYVIYA